MSQPFVDAMMPDGSRLNVVIPMSTRPAATAEQHDEWAEGRRYLGQDVLARCRLRPVSDDATATGAKEVTAPTLPALSA